MWCIRYSNLSGLKGLLHPSTQYHFGLHMFNWAWKSYVPLSQGEGWQEQPSTRIKLVRWAWKKNWNGMRRHFLLSSSLASLPTLDLTHISLFHHVKPCRWKIRTPSLFLLKACGKTWFHCFQVGFQFVQPWSALYENVLERFWTINNWTLKVLKRLFSETCTWWWEAPYSEAR